MLKAHNRDIITLKQKDQSKRKGNKFCIFELIKEKDVYMHPIKEQKFTFCD